MLPSELVRNTSAGDLETFGPVGYECVTTVPDPEQLYRIRNSFVSDPTFFANISRKLFQIVLNYTVTVPVQRYGTITGISLENC
jgi:hypothetical protein